LDYPNFIESILKKNPLSGDHAS